MNDTTSTDHPIAETTEQAETPTRPRAPARRRFLANSAGLGVGFAGSTLLAACGGGSNNADAADDSGPSDAAILNFALNLEYLEAEFYLAAVGDSLSGTDGQGTQGSVTGGRKVSFATPAIEQYAKEIAADEKAHVEFLRSQLGSAKVARPALNIAGTASGAFTAAARAAKVIGPSDTFDPYANENNFLLAAYIFEDVGVTAYKGASPLIDSKTYLEAAAGILAAEAYHASLVRTVLYNRGLGMASGDGNLQDSANKISAARDKLDDGQATDKDQGITIPDDGTSGSTGMGATANIVPVDKNGIAFSRSPGDVLNIVYLDAGSVGSGGFFPNGVNGTLNTSSG